MIKTLAVKNLHLHNFRNFNQLDLTFKPQPVVITGDNGVGKTNILEAISFISPGKGLRGAKLHEINNFASEANWSLSSTIQSISGLIDISLKNTSSDSSNASKELLINNKKTASKAELSQIFSLLWLTPQMDNLFLATSSDRRKFFDRIVFAFFPHHATITNEYNHYLKERNKVLLLPAPDETWLNILEQKIVETGLKIADARIQTIDILNENCCHLEGKFPRAKMAVSGEVEAWLKSDCNYAANLYLIALKNNRKMDMYSKRTNVGVHKSDFLVSNLELQKEARVCSTGEQKSLLISIILSYAKAKITHTEIAPVLLFDEITVHLDNIKKKYLFEELFALNCQFFITNVTDTDFIDLGSSVQRIAMDKTGIIS